MNERRRVVRTVKYQSGEVESGVPKIVAAIFKRENSPT